MPRVLIVDDHPFIRRGVQSILNASPEWELCGEANNGNEAIALTDTLLPEVIIMDISMPGRNGIEAARLIRKAHPQIKIILMTLHETGELVRSAFRAGAQGYLLKAEAEQELLRALQEVVSEDRLYISPRVDHEVVSSVLQENSGNGQSRRA